jgi:hypothetical protein
VKGNKMSKSENGSLAGSKNVKRCAKGGNWGDLGRDGAGGNLAEGKGCEHAQKKASRVPHLHANSLDNEK